MMEPADRAGPHRCAVCRLDATKPALVATIDRTPVAVMCDRHQEGGPPAPGLTSYGDFARLVAQRHPGARFVVTSARGFLTFTAEPADQPGGLPGEE